MIVEDKKPDRRKELVYCPKCNEQLKRGSLTRHQNKEKGCYVNTHFKGYTYFDIKEALENTSRNIAYISLVKDSIAKEKQELEKELDEIKKENSYLKRDNHELVTLLGQTNSKFQFKKDNVEILIKNFKNKPPTIEAYLTVWNKYVDWCFSDGRSDEESPSPLLVSTADRYIDYLFSKEGRQYTHNVSFSRAALQTILRRILKTNLLLEKFKLEKVLKKPKLFLSPLQMTEFLQYLKEKDSPYYLPVRIQARTGARINGVANIKIDDLLFIKDGVETGSYNIFIPDRKTKISTKAHYLDCETRELLKDHYLKHKTLIDSNRYLFYCGENERRTEAKKRRTYLDSEYQEHQKKAAYLGRQINHECELWTNMKKLNKCTTHANRRFWFNNSLDKITEDIAIKEVSRQGGHSNINVTQVSYLRKDRTPLSEIVERKLAELIKDSRIEHTVLPYSNLTNSLSKRSNIQEQDLTLSEDEEEELSDDEKFNLAMSKLGHNRKNKINKVIEEEDKLLKKKVERTEKSSRSSKVTEFLLPDVDNNDNRILKQTLSVACKERGMTFDDNLSFVYNTENDPGVSNYVQTLKGKNLEIFKNFKSRTNKKIYGPLELVKDPIQGWKVVATKPIRKHTLISEYSGVVQDNTEEIKNSDSIMEYFNSDLSDLVINPEKRGNLARFLSGVNTEKVKKLKRSSKHKQGRSTDEEPINLPNCQSQKFNVDGGLHVIIYTLRDISVGETLFYDYNAGGLDEVNTGDYI